MAPEAVVRPNSPQETGARTAPNARLATRERLRCYGATYAEGCRDVASSQRPKFSKVGGSAGASLPPCCSPEPYRGVRGFFLPYGHVFLSDGWICWLPRKRSPPSSMSGVEAEM